MNSVSIIGFLREKIDNTYRYFEYEMPFDEEEIHLKRQIVVKYWEGQENSRLIVLPSNTRVAIQGRLDASDKFGKILIVEIFQVLH